MSTIRDRLPGDGEAPPRKEEKDRPRLPGDGKAPPRKEPPRGESEYQPLLQNTIHRCLPKPENQSESSAKPKAK